MTKERMSARRSKHRGPFTAKPRPPHDPLAVVVHARSEDSATATLCKPRAEWLGVSSRMAEEGEAATCNACQRSASGPAYERSKKVPRKRARRFSGQRRFETRAEMEARA